MHRKELVVVKTIVITSHAIMNVYTKLPIYILLPHVECVFMTVVITFLYNYSDKMLIILIL